MRIVSLLPSATEIVFALGLDDSLVGVTFECDFPPEARQKRIVSTSALEEGLAPSEIDAAVKERLAAGEDLYHLDRGAFAEIDPTLVITQDLCSVCAVDVTEVDDALSYLSCTADVLTLDPMSLPEVLATIDAVGEATGSTPEAREMTSSLRERLAIVRDAASELSQPQVLLLEWTDPAFTAGHWVPDLVAAAGGLPVLANPGENSVGIGWEEVRASNADIVIVSPCGYRLDGATTLATQILGQGVLPPNAQVWAIDADHYVVRPGPRLVDGVEILSTLLHPETFGAPSDTTIRRIR
ncbi:MAG: ABC transporter substrate-binding protein [Acidimicrobiales bacterium]